MTCPSHPTKGNRAELIWQSSCTCSLYLPVSICLHFWFFLSPLGCVLGLALLSTCWVIWVALSCPQFPLKWGN